MNPSTPSTGVLLSAFEQHYAELVRYIARRTGSMEEARGLAHDTWLRIAERQADQDVALADPRAYLFTISHNVAMNHLRRGNWLQGYLAECGAIDGAAPAQAPDVAESAMYRQAVARVEAALGSLPARVRDNYLAHGLHGEKQVDIAERLGLSIDTVKRDIAQATRCIEDALHAWRHTQNANRGGGAAIAGRTGRRKSLAALLGVFAVGVSGTAVWQHLQREALRYQTTLATLRGRLLQRSLPDGSEVTLDAQSRLEVDYTATRRLTRLREGAAFFSVQRDEARPFVVQALGVEVAVLGTRFGVEIDGGRGVVVQVESGRVQVDADGRRAELGAGQSLRIAGGERVLTTVAHPAAWRQGELAFDAVPLADALGRMARYSQTELRVAPAAARLPISGKVRVAEAQSWLASLPSVLPVRVDRQQDGSIDIVRR
ncbi:sigma-70 family RNA polymerase sigma factor [Variovorax ginsengisoli]|uniref:RNA polymerase sigma factor (Sigma-70 family) n=1 Tax=Variovorax ginsengisoli TaxID=363844 RepID=A0ABT9S534_9BURK|nr:sigma-70 family RNA polymerase sigma factor [Variovorax ginsengisoli]MDP9899468.1 RNA polymerase sigma factor (sigma-70 family) [Variovorax ginsengisoli]